MATACAVAEQPLGALWQGSAVAQCSASLPIEASRPSCFTALAAYAHARVRVERSLLLASLLPGPQCAVHRTPLPASLISAGAVQEFGVNVLDESSIDRAIAKHKDRITTVWSAPPLVPLAPPLWIDRQHMWAWRTDNFPSVTDTRWRFYPPPRRRRRLNSSATPHLLGAHRQLAAPLSVETDKDPNLAMDVTVGGMRRVLQCMARHGVSKLMFSDSIGSFGAEGYVMHQLCWDRELLGLQRFLPHRNQSHACSHACADACPICTGVVVVVVAVAAAAAAATVVVGSCSCSCTYAKLPTALARLFFQECASACTGVRWSLA